MRPGEASATASARPGTSGARVRVFIATYRRHDLLPRAVASLRAQSRSDWVCELHNDDPDDPFPGELVRQLGDPRITLRTHATRLGGLATFNLIFRSPAEPFYSLLEDDNWWEPDFLATMISALEAHPEIDVAWSNQQIWQQNPDGSWTDTGRLVNPIFRGDPQLMPWGDPRQALGAISSNSSMLIRSSPGRDYPTPNMPITSVEGFRERLFRHPLLYVPAPVASFAVTLASARAGENERWLVSLVLLAATFVRHGAAPPRQLCAKLWAHYAAQKPPPTNLLLWAAVIEPSCRPFLAQAGGRDWLRWLGGIARRPRQSWHFLRARARHPDWWSYLDAATAARWAEWRRTEQRSAA